MKSGSKGTFALVLSALAFAFTIYIGMWNNDRHSGQSSCDTSYRYYSEQNCRAETEDKNLMLGSGAVAVGLLVFGLVRRYQPGSGRGEDHPSQPPHQGKAG